MCYYTHQLCLPFIISAPSFSLIWQFFWFVFVFVLNSFPTSIKMFKRVINLILCILRWNPDQFSESRKTLTQRGVQSLLFQPGVLVSCLVNTHTVEEFQAGWERGWGWLGQRQQSDRLGEKPEIHNQLSHLGPCVSLLLAPSSAYPSWSKFHT